MRVLAADRLAQAQRPLAEQPPVKRHGLAVSRVIRIGGDGDRVPALPRTRKIRPVFAELLRRSEALMDMTRPAGFDLPVEPMNVAERRSGGHVEAAVRPARGIA